MYKLKKSFQRIFILDIELVNFYLITTSLILSNTSDINCFNYNHLI